MPPTTVPAPGDSFNFAQHLLVRNASRAGKAAFVDEVGALSYGALEDRVRRLATGLRALGIRSRDAYQTRHTYATTALMGGVNPAYIARQLGHKSAAMLFRHYSKWIDHADYGREAAKLNQIYGS